MAIFLISIIILVPLDQLHTSWKLYLIELIRAFNRSGPTVAVALDISKNSGQIFGFISSSRTNRRLQVALGGKSYKNIQLHSLPPPPPLPPSPPPPSFKGGGRKFWLAPPKGVHWKIKKGGWIIVQGQVFLKRVGMSLFLFNFLKVYHLDLEFYHLHLSSLPFAKLC